MASTFSPLLSAQAGGEPDQLEKIFDRQRVQLSCEGFGSCKIKVFLLNIGRDFKAESSLQAQDFCCVVRSISCSKDQAFLPQHGEGLQDRGSLQAQEFCCVVRGVSSSKNKAFLLNMGENFKTEAASNSAEGSVRLLTRRCSLLY